MRGEGGAAGGRGAVVDGAAGGIVELEGRVGHFCVIGEQLGDGVFGVGARVGVADVEARGIVGEFAAGGGDGDA